MLIINGVVVPTPKSMSISINDIDAETGRNANGTIVRDRVAVKRKIECEWGMLTQEEMQTLLNAVTPVFFSVKYIDPQTGITTKTMYVGDRTAPVYNFNSKFKTWSSLKMNFIEK
ncbi:DUF6711 family protein [Parvimonas micra]